MAGETEVLGENLPRRYFVHHKSHLTRKVRFRFEYNFKMNVKDTGLENVGWIHLA
jgi:hypothetical protein